VDVRKTGAYDARAVANDNARVADGEIAWYDNAIKSTNRSTTIEQARQTPS